MSPRKRQPDQFPFLDGEEFPCIWMSAGVISYRLCDREFNCEDCPLDAAIRGGSAPNDVDAERIHAEPEALVQPARDLDDGRRYGRYHSWVAGRDGRVRCGLDDFAARLLTGITTIVLPLPNSRVRRDAISYWLQDRESMIPLRTPIDGTVRRVNRKLQEEPNLLMRDPYGEGWLIEVDCDQPIDALPGLFDAAEQARRTRQDRIRFREAATQTTRSDPRVGPTLHDGGESIEGFRRLLDSKDYRRLVLSILD